MNLFPGQRSPFRKSSYSDRNNCVEVADTFTGAAVRDSQNPAEGHLALPAAEWSALLAGVRAGEL